jgi:integrase
MYPANSIIQGDMEIMLAKSAKGKVKVKGSGTVFYDAKRGCYRWQLIIGTNSNGSSIRKSGSASTKKEATKMMEEKKLLFQKHSPNLDYLNATVDEWFLVYINSYMAIKNRKNTMNGVLLNYEKHIKPQIGRIKLTELTGASLQVMYNQLATEGRIDGNGGLSGNTIRRIHNIVHQALEQAVAEDIIVKNPSKQVVLKKAVQKEYVPYNSEELNRLLSATKGEWLYAAIVTLSYTGLRRSELLGLSWKDIDFDSRVIKVERAYTNQGNDHDHQHGYELMPTKTEKSKRIIPMAQPVAEVLLQKKHELQLLRLKSGDRNFNQGDMVFVNQDGILINGSQFTQKFKSILKRYNLRQIRVHDLRHSFASQSLKSGTKIESVRDMLGHSNIQTTLNIYRHVDLEEKQADIDRLSEFLKVSEMSKK